MSDVIVTESVKRCTKCKVEKPVSAFSKLTKSKDGLQLHCRACRSSWYEATKERVKARVKAYRIANPERCRAVIKACRDANPEKYRATKKACRDAKPEKYRAMEKACRAANPEKYRAMEKAWRDANPERHRATAQRRRARKRNSLGSHTAQQVKDLLQKQRGKCAYCKKDIRKVYHVDHIVALVNGGSNSVMNIQLLCPSCNLRKQAKDPIRFAQEQGLLL